MERLGKLKKVDLRKAWNHEAHNFTQWLSREENLELLSEEIGIDIKLVQTEASVGKFNVDILAEEENTGRKIIIENQLESTNHDHLGKLITYSAGHDAEISIWIVKDVRDEHIRAVDWLNEHTDDDTNFFLIKMELWQIGESSPAPKFQVISKPNDWAKAIKEASSTGREPTETKLRLRGTRPQHWYTVAIGSSIAHISYTVNTRENRIGCEIYIPREKDLFKELTKQKEKIEKNLEMDLEWMELPGKNASRIKTTHPADINKSEDWESYFSWMQETGEKFQSIFGKYIKQIKSG